MYSSVSHRPGDNDKHIEAVPRLRQVGGFADESHCQDFDAHLDGEEDEDAMVERFEDATTNSDAGCRVSARLVHAQRHAVQKDYRHANPLKPAEIVRVKNL